MRWSPQQISNALRARFPDRPETLRRADQGAPCDSPSHANMLMISERPVIGKAFKSAISDALTAERPVEAS